MQELALNACTTLVSVDPKLTMATRDRILQVRGLLEHSNSFLVFYILKIGNLSAYSIVKILSFANLILGDFSSTL